MMIGKLLTISPSLTRSDLASALDPAGTRRSLNSRFDCRPGGAERNRRIDRSASAGCVSALSSLAFTWMSISGFADVNSPSRGTKLELSGFCVTWPVTMLMVSG